MPILNLRLSTPPDARQSAAIAATLSGLTAQLLHKAPELTSVAISHLDAAHWFVGGPRCKPRARTVFSSIS